MQSLQMETAVPAHIYVSMIDKSAKSKYKKPKPFSHKKFSESEKRKRKKN